MFAVVWGARVMKLALNLPYAKFQYHVFLVSRQLIKINAALSLRKPYSISSNTGAERPNGHREALTLGMLRTIDVLPVRPEPRN